MNATQYADFEHAATNRTEIPFVLGRIEARTEAGLLVAAASELIPARAAASCLIAPRPGDRVALLVGPDASWITAVLEREDDTETTLEFGGALRLHATGSMHLESDRIGMSGRQLLDLKAPRICFSSHVVQVLAGTVDWIADRVDGRFNVMKLAGRLLEGVFDRFSQRSGSSLREVETIDSVRTAEADYRASGTMMLGAENLLGQAEQLVSLDGDQIHMG